MNVDTSSVKEMDVDGATDDIAYKKETLTEKATKTTSDFKNSGANSKKKVDSECKKLVVDGECDYGENDEFSEHYDYDLVGVTVHTGTADGGHYYSFIKERGPTGLSQDRWLLFNDAEVKVFDPSQIASECFGGEMTVSDKEDRKTD